MNEQNNTLMNFSIGMLISLVCSIFYMVGNVFMFTYADYGKPLPSVMEKIAPSSMNNLGVLPPYIAVKLHNRNYDKEGRHADLIKLTKSSKKGAVLVLWTPSCPRCKTQLKALASLSKKHKDIKFISVVSTLGGGMKQAKEYWEKNVGNDHNMILIEDLPANKLSLFRSVFSLTNYPAVPTTVFVNNKTGKILSAVAGPIKWDQHGSKIVNCKFEG